MPERFECTSLTKKALYKYSSFPFLFNITFFKGLMSYVYKHVIVAQVTNKHVYSSCWQKYTKE